MNFFQSNYPNTGGYGMNGAYGQSQYNSAYNVNQYGHQPQQFGVSFSFGMGMNPAGAVPGFTVPAVQQYSQMHQGHQAPPPVPMPTSGYIQNFDQSLQQFQMQQQQMMMTQMQQQMMQQQMMQTQMMMNNNNGNRDNNDGADKEQESAPEPPAVSEEEMQEKVKVMLRESFVNELMRRQKVAGTFEATSGTVRPLDVYPEEDPVAVWFKEQKGEDLTGKEWYLEADCEYLNEAMQGLGTNEDAIINVVATRCNSQRQELMKYFKTMTGRDLVKEIESELSGDFKETVMALFVKPAEYDAWCIKEAIYGPGTDEDTLIEILMTRTNAQIEEMKEVYGNVVSPHRKTEDTKLEEDIEGDTSGDFKRLLISAAQGNRDEIDRERLEEAVREIIREDGEGTGMYEVDYEALTNMDRARRAAEELFKAGEDRWGTDEETFNRIFSTRDYYTLRLIWKEYVKICQRDILNSVDRETSGDFRQALRAIVMNIRCRPMFFAEKLQQAMKGLGTAERTLIRVIVTRSEIDMVQIKQCFLELTKQTLWNWLEDDCSGDYKKLLQKIVGKN